MVGPSSNDLQTIQSAIDALPAEGGTVELDAGTFSFVGGHIRLRDGVRLVGQGACATRIVLEQTKWGAKAESAVGVEIAGIAWEQTILQRHLGCVYLFGARDAVIHDCWMGNTAGDEWGGTWLAVGCSQADGVEVRDCELLRMQLKLSGPGGGYNLAVRRCKFERPHNFAVSAVGKLEGDVVANVVVEDVKIEDAGGDGALYFGSDVGDNHEQPPDMRLDGVLVRNVEITGDVQDRAPRGWKAVMVRPPSGGSGPVTVDGIDVDVYGQRNKLGVIIKGVGGVCERLTVRDAHIKGTETGAIVARSTDVVEVFA